jgi:hypothetical protein
LNGTVVSLPQLAQVAVVSTLVLGALKAWFLFDLQSLHRFGSFLKFLVA